MVRSQNTTVSRWLVIPIAAIRIGTALRDHLARAREGGVPDFGGIMLDQAGAGIMLPDFALRAAERRAVGAEKHRARRRRSSSMTMIFSAIYPHPV